MNLAFIPQSGSLQRRGTLLEEHHPMPTCRERQRDARTLEARTRDCD